MVEELFASNVLAVLNCIFQGIIAVAAVIAIRITIRQISGRANVNMKMNTEFRLNEVKDEGFIVELAIHMVNLGMATVYVSECGICLWAHRKPKFRMRISDDSFVLKSGQSRTVCGEYNGEMLDDMASLRDKVRIYAICQMDKVYYDKKKHFYNDFKHKYEKVARRVNKLTQLES